MADFENSNNPNLENKNSIQAWENVAKYKCKSSENILAKSKQIEQRMAIEFENKKYNKL
jgi:hypothetical protein